MRLFNAYSSYHVHKTVFNFASMSRVRCTCALASRPCGLPRKEWIAFNLCCTMNSETHYWYGCKRGLMWYSHGRTVRRTDGPGFGPVFVGVSSLVRRCVSRWVRAGRRTFNCRVRGTAKNVKRQFRSKVSWPSQQHVDPFFKMSEYTSVGTCGNGLEEVPGADFGLLKD